VWVSPFGLAVAEKAKQERKVVRVLSAASEVRDVAIYEAEDGYDKGVLGVPK
jgi:hypothetical protein